MPSDSPASLKLRSVLCVTHGYVSRSVEKLPVLDWLLVMEVSRLLKWILISSKHFLPQKPSPCPPKGCLPRDGPVDPFHHKRGVKPSPAQVEPPPAKWAHGSPWYVFEKTDYEHRQVAYCLYAPVSSSVKRD